MNNLELAQAIALFLDLAGDARQLRLQRIDAASQGLDGIARLGRTGADRAGRADLRIQRLRRAIGKDAALERAHILFEPADAPLDRLLLGGGGERGKRGRGAGAVRRAADRHAAG